METDRLVASIAQPITVRVQHSLLASLPPPPLLSYAGISLMANAAPP